MKSIPKSAEHAMGRVLQGSQSTAMPQFSSLKDPRKARGKRYSFLSMVKLCFAGMLGGFRTLRDVAVFGLRRNFGVSYTALYFLLAKLKAEQFRPLLHQQVRSLYRSKALEPVGFPCHIIAIDNKTLYYGPKRLNAHCQKTHDAHSGQVRYHLRTLRAVLVSSPLKVALDQQVTPASQNDMSFFLPFFRKLEKLYGRGLLFKAIISTDSGMASFENTKELHRDGYSYVMALKENQPNLLEEARRVLTPLEEHEPEWTTPWEVYQGKERRFKLFRTKELAGWPAEVGDWDHLRQVWLVVTEERCPKGRRKKGRRKKDKTPNYTEPKELERRYFFSNLLWNFLSSKQILALVRAHWGVENGCNWTTDVVWNEDDSPWCRKGEALEVLSLLRLMAYNMLRWLKGRHLRNDVMKKWSWKQWLHWIREMMAIHLYLPLKRTRQFCTG